MMAVLALGAVSVTCGRDQGADVERSSAALRANQLSPPANVVASATSTSVLLSWTDTNRGEAGYEIDRDDGRGFQLLAQTNKNATSHRDEAVRAGSYSYRVRAFKRNGDLSIYSDNPVVEVPVTQPVVSPASVTFVDADVGTVSAPPQVVTLTNPNVLTGMSITITVSPAEFQLVSHTMSCGPAGPAMPCNLAPGEVGTLTLVHTPAAAGPRSGTLTIGTAGGPVLVPLSGNGIVSLPTVTPSSLDFGDQAVGTSAAPQTVTITSPDGSSGMSVTLTVSPSEFVLVSHTLSCGPPGPSMPCNLQGSSGTITLSMIPASRGPLSGTLTIGTAKGPVFVPLTGNGI